jgi:hypothetical protein
MLIAIVLADERGKSRYPADGTRKNARRPLGLAGFARVGIKKNQLLDYMRFADLVVMAGRLHPFPFRTRP